MTSKYGMAECYGCYVRLPKPDLYRSNKWSSKQPARSSRDYWGWRGGVWKRTGTSVSNVQSKLIAKTVWRCGRCYRRHLIKLALLWTAGIVFGLFVLTRLEPMERGVSTSGGDQPAPVILNYDGNRQQAQVPVPYKEYRHRKDSHR